MSDYVVNSTMAFVVDYDPANMTAAVDAAIADVGGQRGARDYYLRRKVGQIEGTEEYKNWYRLVFPRGNPVGMWPW